MPNNLNQKTIEDIAAKSLQRLLRTESYDFVRQIPNFPFSSALEIRALVKLRKLHIKIFFDVDLVSKFGTHSDKKNNRTLAILQTILFWIFTLLPVALSYIYNNYWILVGIPLGYIGRITTVPTSKRYIFTLMALISFISFFFFDNPFVKYTLLAFFLVNICNNLLRLMREAIILNIIYTDEKAFIWGFFNKVFLICVVKNGDILLPDMPEDLEIMHFEDIKAAIYE